MPYHVGAKGSSDCGGYPVVDDKGKVMGCHPTKNKAGRQVRALYAAGAAKKFIENNNTAIEKDAVAEGDFVLAMCEDETHVGIVQYVMTNGLFGIPGSEYAEEATPDNPVVLIRTLEFDEEDGWEETPYMIGAMGQEVTKIAPLQIDVEQMTMDKAANPCWEGFKQLGMKRGKNGKMVPNCVPVSKSEEKCCPDQEIDINKKEFSTTTRERMAESGTAMPDGSFPIASRADLQNAIQSVGRAKDYEKAKAHIIRRAKALNALDMLPESWSNMARKGMTGWGGSIFDLNPLVK